MGEPSLVFQTALRARLIASNELTALVPPDNIFDRNARPEVFPCVLIGEGQTVPGAGLSRNRYVIYADIHIWTAEPGLAQGKAIAGAIASALADPRWKISGWHVADLKLPMTRYLRDPDGVYSHAIQTLEVDIGRS